MMKSRPNAVSAGVSLVLIVTFTGCGSTSQPPRAPAPAPLPAPTEEELASASYKGIGDQAVQLSEGTYEGPPFEEGGASRRTVGLIPGVHMVGDLDRDGVEESVAILWENSGGSGVNSYLAIARRGSRGVENIATALIGDRVQLRDARLNSGIVELEVVQSGPEDAACCPGEHAIRRWTFSNGLLEEQPVEIIGRAGFGMLTGYTWKLVQLARGETFMADVSVTLQFDGGQISGVSGCNRYSASVQQGDLPGTIEVGPPMGTRMACPEELMAVERRFLKALSTVRSFGFLNGALALTWADGDLTDTMLFEPEPATE